MTAYASILGMGLMALAGGIALLIALGVTYYFVGVLGTSVFKRLRAVYHWNVLAYWFERLEKDGVRTFQRAEEDDMAYTARLQAAAPTSPTPTPAQEGKP